jgi:hypothetical protein
VPTPPRWSHRRVISSSTDVTVQSTRVRLGSVRFYQGCISDDRGDDRGLVCPGYPDWLSLPWELIIYHAWETVPRGVNERSKGGDALPSRLYTCREPRSVKAHTSIHVLTSTGIIPSFKFIPHELLDTPTSFPSLHPRPAPYPHTSPNTQGKPLLI